MSNSESNAPAEQGGMPAWSEKEKFMQTRLWFRILIVVIVILWLALIVWVFVTPIEDAEALPLEVGANLTIVLAPILAAAAAVERTLESIFNMLENSWRTMIAYLGRGLRWLKNAEIEVQQARRILAEASAKYNAELQGIQLGQVSISELSDEIRAKVEAADRLTDLAKQRLEKAEDNLAAVTSSDKYIRAKSAASIIVGLMLGVVVAAIGQLQIFAMLGIGIVPARIDVLVTGLVIGSGSYPVHSLVGILQQGKDALNSVKGYLDNRGSSSAPQTSQNQVTANN